MESKQTNHVIITSIDVHDNYIVVGDILKSAYLYFYDSDTNTIEEIAKDFRSGMVRDAIMIDNDKYYYYYYYYKK